uniref:DUF295 domain-containing protein n=1 Tax=Heterorhabditis bacteriophora TaxID=37862 RepID=A0A1I7WAT6_HETBA
MDEVPFYTMGGNFMWEHLPRIASKCTFKYYYTSAEYVRDDEQSLVFIKPAKKPLYSTGMCAIVFVNKQPILTLPNSVKATECSECTVDYDSVLSDLFCILIADSDSAPNCGRCHFIPLVPCKVDF